MSASRTGREDDLQEPCRLLLIIVSTAVEARARSQTRWKLAHPLAEMNLQH